MITARPTYKRVATLLEHVKACRGDTIPVTVPTYYAPLEHRLLGRAGAQVVEEMRSGELGRCLTLYHVDRTSLVRALHRQRKEWQDLSWQHAPEDGLTFHDLAAQTLVSGVTSGGKQSRKPVKRR